MVFEAQLCFGGLSSDFHFLKSLVKQPQYPQPAVKAARHIDGVSGNLAGNISRSSPYHNRRVTSPLHADQDLQNISIHQTSSQKKQNKSYRQDCVQEFGPRLHIDNGGNSSDGKQYK